MSDSSQTAVIIGAGPAGLTAALEFCRRSSIRPIVLEASDRIGGLSCTVCHNGNRMDLGGHRFFSKSDRVLNWWLSILPLDETREIEIGYHNRKRTIRLGIQEPADEPGDPDCVMLVRPRKSRIYYQRALFDYPLSLDLRTLRRLGLRRTLRILAGYTRAQIRLQPENSLEDFLINRFGRELYQTFFQSYTEKVWGVPCRQIPAEWGAQRIRGVSLGKAVRHFLAPRIWPRRNGNCAFPQRDTETSLIEQFLYPKFGPGQLWERVAHLVEKSGGEVRRGWQVTRLCADTDSEGTQRISHVEAIAPDGQLARVWGDHFFSTMPVRDLFRALDQQVPPSVRLVSEGLTYRDLIVVALLVDRLLITEPDGAPARDTWIYVHEPGVMAGRIQIMNNWSPYMVADPDKMWIGLEYFCSEDDSVWGKSDDEIKHFAIAEAASIGVLLSDEVRDACVFRVPKAYPAYFGTYDRFSEISSFLERFQNLFLVGRNGMHRYNNQDHSMLTAMVAVDNILSGSRSRQNLWEVNTEQEYHEEAQADGQEDSVVA